MVCTNHVLCDKLAASVLYPTWKQLDSTTSFHVSSTFPAMKESQEHFLWDTRTHAETSTDTHGLVDDLDTVYNSMASEGVYRIENKVWSQ